MPPLAVTGATLDGQVVGLRAAAGTIAALGTGVEPEPGAFHAICVGLELAKMVLLGKVNSVIVRRLTRHGQPAVGLSGEDGTLFEVRPHADAELVGLVGEVERVDVDVLNHIAEDYIPVIASIGADAAGRASAVDGSRSSASSSACTSTPGRIIRYAR